MYAREVLADGKVVDRRCDSTVIGTSQSRSQDERMEAHLFTTLAVATMHLPSFLLIPNHRIVCVIQPVIRLRVDLKRRADCFRLGPRVNDQRCG